MSSPFYRVRSRLAPVLRNHLDRWEIAIRAYPQTDELGRRVGVEVSRNVRHDGAVGVRAMDDFLNDLVVGSGAHAPHEAVEIYRKSCHRRQRQGPKATLLVNELWHVFPERQLLTLIERKFRGVKRGSAWKRFRDAYNVNDKSTYFNMLDSVSMHPMDFQVFAAIELTSPRRSVSLIFTKDAQGACAALGLSKDWDGYRAGDHLWIVKYELERVESFVPTFADACWRSIFRPSKRRSATYGLTIPLGPARAIARFSGK